MKHRDDVGNGNKEIRKKSLTTETVAVKLKVLLTPGN